MTVFFFDVFRVHLKHWQQRFWFQCCRLVFFLSLDMTCDSRDITKKKKYLSYSIKCAFCTQFFLFCVLCFFYFLVYFHGFTSKLILGVSDFDALLYDHQRLHFLVLLLFSSFSLFFFTLVGMIFFSYAIFVWAAMNAPTFKRTSE